MALPGMTSDKINALFADKRLRRQHHLRSIGELKVKAVIPSKSKQPVAFDRNAHERCNLIERMYDKRKHWRCVTRRLQKSLGLELLRDSVEPSGSPSRSLAERLRIIANCTGLAGAVD